MFRNTLFFLGLLPLACGGRLGEPDETTISGGSSSVSQSAGGNANQSTPGNATTTSVVEEGGAADVPLRYISQREVEHRWGSAAYVVLVTDGMASVDGGCRNLDRTSSTTTLWPPGSGDDIEVASVEAIIAEIARVAAQGVRTIVVGTPGTEPSARSWLSRAAIAGGTAQSGCSQTGGGPYCHLDMSANIDLNEAITKIVTPSLPFDGSCRFEIPSMSSDGQKNVESTQIWPLITDGSGQVSLLTRHEGPREPCNVGYYVVDPTTVELCETSCAMLMNDCKARMSLVFGREPSGISTPPL